MSERKYSHIVFSEPYRSYSLAPNGDVYYEKYYDRDENGNSKVIVKYNINTDAGLDQFIIDLKEAGKEERNQEIKKFFGSILK